MVAHRDGHSSRPPVARRFKPPTRTLGGASCAAQAARVPIWCCSGWGFACRPCHQVRGGLLPHLFTLARNRLPGHVGGMFSVPLSVAAQPKLRSTWPLASTMPCGVRTFLPCLGACALQQQRSPGPRLPASLRPAHTKHTRIVVELAVFVRDPPPRDAQDRQWKQFSGS